MAIGRTNKEEQVAIVPPARHYHEPVVPQSSTASTVLAAFFGLICCFLLVVGAIQAFSQVALAGVILVYIAASGIPLLVLAAVAGMIWREWYMARIKKRHAEADLKAKEDQMEAEKELAEAEAERVRAEARRIDAEAEVMRVTVNFDEQGNAALRNPHTWQVIQLQGQMREHPALHSLNYRYDYKDTSTKVTEEGQGQIGQGLALPKLEQFLEAIPFNSLQTGMGLDMVKQQLVITQIEKSTHFKLIGGSDMGKSCVAAAMIDIATSTNDPEHLQLGLLDMEYNTSRLFEHVPHIAELGPKKERLIGRDANEVAFKLNLLYTELQRRERLGEAYCRQHLPLILVYVEELLALKYEVDKKLKQRLLETINIMGVRARKYLIYFLAVMQTDYSDKDTREGMAQYRTRAGFAIDPDTARASGFFSKELIKENFQTGRKGQYVLEKPGFQGIVLAPDYDVKAKLLMLSGATMSTTTEAPIIGSSDHYQHIANQALDSGSIVARNFTTIGTPQAGLEGLSEQDKRILRKLRTMTPSAVIASEFSDKNGKPLKAGNDFIEKTKYVQSLIARFLPAEGEI